MTHHVVLVTGATGFIARHVVHQLLEAGHEVVGSVRSLSSGPELREALGRALADPAALERLRLVELDMDENEGWMEAMEGVDVVMHTASPVPDGKSEIAESFITTAIGGTLRACKAAYASGIRRIIVTSSIAAIMGAPGHDNGEDFDESDWSDPERPNINNYSKSKVLSERALWDWARDEAPEAKVTTINPAFVMGPPLSTGKVPSSLNIVGRLLEGVDPGLPDVNLPLVDVRDVARMHVLAMDLPVTEGKRYISSESQLNWIEIAELLHETCPDHPVPTRKVPKFVLKLAGVFRPEARAMAAGWGKSYPMSNARAREDMGMHFIAATDSIRETAQYLVANDMLDKA